MSQLRSLEMSLFEVVVPRDNAWDIMNEYLALDYIHYYELNGHLKGMDQLYTTLVKRADITMR